MADPDPRPIIRLCVDLNVWVRHLLSIRKGAHPHAAHAIIVDAVRTGRSPAGPVQLIVSHTMLSRLEDVLLCLEFPAGDASALCSLIGAFARRGPYGVAPHIVLGGGVSPTRESRMRTYDPYDPAVLPPRADDEDGRVLDTAVAGRAHILATCNLADFQTPATQTLEAGRLLSFGTARHRLLIADARRAAEFLTAGHFPDISGPATRRTARRR